MAKEILEKLLRRVDLSTDEAHGLMEAMMSGTLPAPQIAALLIALRMKGETVDEIAGLAAGMRAKAMRITPRRDGLVDTCGTGGDAQQTFNISTAAALVAAGMDIPVAKHGNRAVSSRSGSADVLEALGVDITLSPDSVTTLIDEIGIGFLFAPQHHPAMKYAAPVRRELGVRTVFNILGPLTNPAGVKRQLIGVFSAELTPVICGVLQRLGAERAFVVHGIEGTDEVSIAGETQVSALADGKVRTFHFAPEEAGITRTDIKTIAGGTAAENAAVINALLDGATGPRRDAVLLNAGFVAVLADRAPDVAAGVELAREAIDSGRCRAVLDQLRTRSQALGREEGGA